MNTYHFELKLKLFALAICILFLNRGIAQVIKDKDQFAKTFVKIFEQRKTGFDSLMGKQEEGDMYGDYTATVKFPEASETSISMNRVYLALFNFPDSLKAVSFYKELKNLLNVSASLYSAKAKFSQIYPDDPFFELFYFSNETVFTNEGSSIQIMDNTPENNQEDEEEDDDQKSKSNQPVKKTYTVFLTINPGDVMGVLTGGGQRTTDNELNTFISQVAFGKDTALKNIRINKRTQADKILYDSKIGLTGFKTVITEIRKEKIAGINVSASKKYLMDEKSFLKEAENFLLKLKAAFPANYCYEIFNGEGSSTVEFKPVPFQKTSGNEAEVEMRYSAEKGKSNEFTLELFIFRKVHNP